MSENESIEPIEEVKVEPLDSMSAADASDDGVPEIHPVVFFNKDFTPFGEPTTADIETGLYDFRPKTDEQIDALGELVDDPKDSPAPESVAFSDSLLTAGPGILASQETIADAAKASTPVKVNESGTQTSSSQETPGKSERPVAE